MKKRKTVKTVNMPIQKDKCKTCPFRDGSVAEFLRTDIAMDALTGHSRICHSTGGNKVIHNDTNKPEMLCRGARDLQLNYFVSIGFLPEPTDEAWRKKCEEMKLI